MEDHKEEGGVSRLACQRNPDSTSFGKALLGFLETSHDRNVGDLTPVEAILIPVRNLWSIAGQE